MATALLSGTWWLHGTRGCNVYVQRTDDDGVVVVDTGFGSNADAIRNELRSLGCERDVRAILLTHRHVDHAGAAASLSEMLDAPVAAGLADCRRHLNGGYRLTQDWRPPSLVRRPLGVALGISGSHRPVEVSVTIEGTCEIAPGILAMPAPGHTPGTYCYLATASGATFTGDLFISHRDRLSRSMRLANDDDGQYLATLAELAPCVGEHGLPGHGYPVIGRFQETFRELAYRPRRPPRIGDCGRRLRMQLAFAGFLLRRRMGEGP